MTYTEIDRAIYEQAQTPAWSEAEKKAWEIMKVIYGSDRIIFNVWSRCSIDEAETDAVFAEIVEIIERQA